MKLKIALKTFQSPQLTLMKKSPNFELQTLTSRNPFRVLISYPISVRFNSSALPFSVPGARSRSGVLDSARRFLLGHGAVKLCLRAGGARARMKTSEEEDKKRRRGKEKGEEECRRISSNSCK